MDAAEADRRKSLTDAVADLFRSKPAHWFTASEIAEVGGWQASRTRISDCRLKLGMHIENKLERMTLDDGTFAVLSSYRYLDHEPLGRDASTKLPVFQRELFQR